MSVKKFRKVLIVEDERPISKLFADEFSRNAFTVYEAEDGINGLNRAFEVRPDVILLDLVMPKMGGIEMLARLRRDEWGCCVPVIILTNLGDSSVKDLCSAYNTSGIFLKTEINLEQMVADVRKSLKRKTDL